MAALSPITEETTLAKIDDKLQAIEAQLQHQEEQLERLLKTQEKLLDVLMLEKELNDMLKLDYT
jgi:hypothetical protein